MIRPPPSPLCSTTLAGLPPSTSFVFRTPPGITPTLTPHADTCTPTVATTSASTNAMLQLDIRALAGASGNRNGTAHRRT
jgi:hypothetical protein